MKNTGAYPRVRVDTARVAAVGQAGGVLLTETVRATGLDLALSDALSPWRKPFAVHDPGKVVLDLAIALADMSAVRGEPDVFGRVASDPTVSRTITPLPRTRVGRSRRSTRHAKLLAPTHGRWPASTPPIMPRA